MLCLRYLDGSGAYWVTLLCHWMQNVWQTRGGGAGAGRFEEFAALGG
jgi:hypothetical protein